jgi:hypothetical protein
LISTHDRTLLRVEFASGAMLRIRRGVRDESATLLEQAFTGMELAASQSQKAAPLAAFCRSV